MKNQRFTRSGNLYDKAPPHVVFPHDATAYLTIDEKHLEPGHIQRKPHLHVDGMYKGQLADAWGGGGKTWTVNSYVYYCQTMRNGLWDIQKIPWAFVLAEK